MKPLLALETSGGSLGVALRGEEGLLFEENVTAGSIHGRALAPLIRKALEAQRLKPGDLEAAAISIGPGSWTGLRIGLSCAKALAWGAGLALVAVPSFEALAWDAARHAPQHARLTLRDARSEGFFAALFNETLPAPQRWIEESVLRPAEIVAAVEREMQAHASVPLAVCGDPVCLEALAAAAQRNGWRLLAECRHISAAAVAECGWQRLRRGEGFRAAADIHTVAPLYLRASDPELKLARKR
ncbi:MAG: tRNA (adenosine(37)-N6)-threonylcarbamoyltransferase complex dimerization subunit type 1 TsaB [Planctomycetota bacterium]|nr:tRNA (adenosine(37)-N6)-threonylcarbamoyltransferase complex dimerization subunit type 1 TsaB [Planctomycetota bacterium]